MKGGRHDGMQVTVTVDTARPAGQHWYSAGGQLGYFLPRQVWPPCSPGSRYTKKRCQDLKRFMRHLPSLLLCLQLLHFASMWQVAIALLLHVPT